MKTKKRKWSERDQEILDWKLQEIKERFGTEEDCTAYLYEWQKKMYRCSKCGGRECYRHPTRPLLQCKGCKHQSSLREGTIFYNAKSQLVNWFGMVLLIVKTKSKIPSKTLQRALGIEHYDMVLRMRKKIEYALSLPLKNKNPFLMLANLVNGRDISNQFLRQSGATRLVRLELSEKTLKAIETIKQTLINAGKIKES
jgi:hypothetical protein